MPKLASIEIENFRSCQSTSVPLADFTPLVGCNNAGKSNIMAAIRWLLRPTKLDAQDFGDPSKPLRVTGIVEGLDDAALAGLNPKHKKAIESYCANQRLCIRQGQPSPTEKAAELEVRPLHETEAGSDAFTSNPTGIRQALQALFPEPVEVPAMQVVSDDVSKAKAGSTIHQLISKLTEPLITEHGSALREALDAIGHKLTADGSKRAPELIQFDRVANAALADFFPGLTLSLHLPPPELNDLFKGATTKVFEGQGPGRSIEALGHGAQRSVQMALIRHLADLKTPSSGGTRTLLLIDEPELYLHPQAVELIRLALKSLASRGYQVVFSTHSAQMIRDDDDIKHSVIVRRASNGSTTTLKPLAAAIDAAVQSGPSQKRTLLELGNAAQILFSDRVLLVEGTTEHAVLPSIFRRLAGSTLEGKKVGLVQVRGSGSLLKAMDIIKAIGLPVQGIADLDFAFQHAAPKGMLTGHESAMTKAAAVFSRLGQSWPTLTIDSNGLPTGGEGRMPPAKAFELFAADDEGKDIAQTLHAALLPQGIWMWTRGAVEKHLGVESKKEEVWIELLERLETEEPDAVLAHPQDFRGLVRWLVPTAASAPSSLDSLGGA